MGLDVTKLSDGELKNYLYRFNQEMVRRNTVNKQKLWNNVVEAIKEYCSTFGTYIVVDDDYNETCIDENSFFDKIGIIRIPLEED